jgi:hypothetical protein
MKERPIGSARGGGSILLRCGRFLIASASIVSATAALSCTIVFAMSVLLRGNDPAHDRSIIDPMFLTARQPTTGMQRLDKRSRLLILSSREKLTAEAILAAYQRTVAAPVTEQSSAPPTTVAENAEDRREPATIALEGQLPLPEAKPAFDWRHVGSIAQRKLSASPETGKVVDPAGQQLASLTQPNSTTEPNGDLLSRRTAPDAPPKSSFDWPGRNDRVAIYDISAGVVYLPDGERLEAHSGVGRMRDNPSFVRVKMLGPTPPATYALSLREAAFHGVDAIRLTPVNGSAPFGRDGLLAHTYMLRRPGDSNGCVVFANYNRFLKAFKNNEVNFIRVVPQIQDRLSAADTSLVRG